MSSVRLRGRRRSSESNEADPAEEMIWSEGLDHGRERFDARTSRTPPRHRHRLDCAVLIDRYGKHWRALYAHLVLFGSVSVGTLADSGVGDDGTECAYRGRNQSSSRTREVCYGTILSPAVPRDINQGATKTNGCGRSATCRGRNRAVDRRNRSDAANKETLRIAAVADIHVKKTGQAACNRSLLPRASRPDVLLLCALTDYDLVEEQRSCERDHHPPCAFRSSASSATMISNRKQDDVVRS